MQFLNPRTDFAFNKIFGSAQSKDILLSFLNAILNLETPHQIVDFAIFVEWGIMKIQYMMFYILRLVIDFNINIVGA